VKAIEALRAHWPEYLMEAAALGTFMLSACAFGVLLPRLIDGDPARRVAGGAAGVALAGLLIGQPVAAVNYVTTVPGPQGSWVAFLAEFAISCLMLSTVLRVANSRRWTRFTPWVAGCLVAAFITFESPLSGMSMNPARSFGSALSAGIWTSFWVYLCAPPLAMWLAARWYRGGVFCAKFHHHNQQRCIFRCNYGALQDE
jgi:aquaporin Z